MSAQPHLKFSGFYLELLLKFHLLLFYPSVGTFVIFSYFTQKLKEDVNVLLYGWCKGYVGPPSQIIGGPAPPPPPPPPAPLSSYAYDYVHCLQPIYTMFQVSTTTNLMFTDNTLILHPKISLYTAYSGYKEKLEGT